MSDVDISVYACNELLETALLFLCSPLHKEAGIRFLRFLYVLYACYMFVCSRKQMLSSKTLSLIFY